MSSTKSNQTQTLVCEQQDWEERSPIGGLDARYNSDENKQIAPRREQEQVTAQSGSQSDHGGAPAVRLDMDLDMEIELKAKIKGDVTLAILDDKSKQS
ncbi:hypothetical protein QBC38DRAFT_458856 [Podospora fimiseda]|uniref:Uncharacterized protein n=1 Tax=Podospora fimiseda TaxID=252190 RepID=A0AAN7BIK1_9PEZI|nr:hypothetical protein QBC38DRAFT_458856 [Podospora fimiseda]